LVNLHETNELKCLCYTQLKQELQELLIELKSAIKINILKNEMVCGVNLDKECAKCSVFLFQLQEATVELKSTQFIIKMLQDELNKSCGRSDFNGSEGLNICGTPRSEWKEVKDKHSKKSRNCLSYSSDQDIRTTNSYNVLSEIQTQSDETLDKIPVIINGVTTRKSRSQKFLSRISDFKLGKSDRIKMTKQKTKKHVMKREQKSDHKIIILEDSHARGLAGRL
jgi:hypothetical protein